MIDINNFGHIITIQGNIRNIADYILIKNKIDDVLSLYDEVQIKTDSNTISSSVIGYFVSLQNKYNKKVTLIVSNDNLYSLLDDLNLTKVFNVKRN